eukprot:COSAG03_NODE_22014_length_296_cov_0.974619_1_plen_78_part_10
MRVAEREREREREEREMEREREMDSEASDSESEVRAPAAVGPGVHQAVPGFECLAVLHADRQPVIPEPERGRQDGRTV